MTDKKLQIVSLLAILVPGFVMVAVPLHWLPGPFLDTHTSANAYYTLQMVQVVFIFLIPLALKLMVMDRVKEKIKDNEPRYFNYAILRLMVVELVMDLGALGYLMFGYTEFSVASFCIGLITMMYIWPTRARRLHEMGIEE